MSVKPIKSLRKHLRVALLLVAFFALFLFCWSNSLRIRTWQTLPTEKRDPHASLMCERRQWSPKDFYDDPQTVELCYAIELDDFDRIEELLDEGVDINARGKGGMTPLLWAYPLGWMKHFYNDRKSRENAENLAENKPKLHETYSNEKLNKQFISKMQRLMDLGADPNLRLADDFEDHFAGGVYYVAGISVTHLSVWPRPLFEKHEPLLPVVLQHGGDPDILFPQEGITPIFNAIKANQGQNTGMPQGGCYPKSVALLIEAGADIEFEDPEGCTPLTIAGKERRYDVAYMLLCAGACYKKADHNNNSPLKFPLYASSVFRYDLAKLKERYQGRFPDDAFDDQWHEIVSDEDVGANPIYYFKVLDWLQEHDPSMREKLDQMKSEVKAIYRDEFQIDIEQLEYDPWPEEWGNQYMKEDR